MIRYDWKMDDKGQRVLNISYDANYRIEIVDVDGNNSRVIELKDAKTDWPGGPFDWR